MIERDLTVHSVVPDSLDIHPRPDVCHDMHAWWHEMIVAGFFYRICGRCGVVRIAELKALP